MNARDSELSPPDWVYAKAPMPDSRIAGEAAARQDILTKPQGALGRLEKLVVDLAAMQGRVCPVVDKVHISVFAGDHGVAGEGVSAFPQSVTAQMLSNFSRGGAAINVVANEIGADLDVVNLGTIAEVESGDLIIERIQGQGTANFLLEPAMTPTQLNGCLETGREMALKAVDAGKELFIGGDMGIGNTTASAAIACVALEMDASKLVGPGTGLDDDGLAHKVSIVEKALAHHDLPKHPPLDILRVFGGFEIAALTGAFLTCAQSRLPVLVDGYIASTAALLAIRINFVTAAWMLWSHRSAEPGHTAVLENLNAEPILDLGMRLGEGSGAAIAVPILRTACALHRDMATFEDAGVSDRSESNNAE